MTISHVAQILSKKKTSDSEVKDVPNILPQPSSMTSITFSDFSTTNAGNMRRPITSSPLRPTPCTFGLRSSSPKFTTSSPSLLKPQESNRRPLYGRKNDINRIGNNSISKPGIRRKFKKLNRMFSKEEYASLIDQSSREIPNITTLLKPKAEIIDLTEETETPLKIFVKNIITPKPEDIVKTQMKVLKKQEANRGESEVDVEKVVLRGIWREEDNEVLELESLLKQLTTDRYDSQRKVRDRYKNDVDIIRKKLPKVVKLPPLPTTIESTVDDKVMNIWSYGRGSEEVAEFDRNTCTREDLRSLKGLSWLNDGVMNFYYSIISGRSREHEGLPKVHVFTTFFYPKLKKAGHSGVKRWTRKINIFGFDSILIPIHLGVHWTCAAILVKEMKIIYLDSMGGSNRECRRLLLDYLKKEHKLRLGTDLDHHWHHMSLSDQIPQQDNSSDCGVFSCKFADYIALGFSKPEQFNFATSHMQNFRKLICYHILQQKLPSPYD